MKRLKAASLITAIKTPYNAAGEIDLVNFDELVEQQIAGGVEGIIVGGTTGEGQLMNWEEHLMLIAHSANKFGDRIIIIGNTGSNNTREAIKATEYGFASGMDAALQINPYYGRTSEQGVVEHFKKVLPLGPMFVYNVPGRTGQDITPDMVEQIADHPNFIGMKECAGNDRIAAYEAKGIACWSGNDDEAFDGRHSAKSHGVMSVTANIAPSLMRKLMDDESAASLNERMQPLMSWLFCEPNPIAINTALAMTGAVNPIFRLPYVALNAEQRAQGIELLKGFDLSEIVGSEIKPLADEDFTYLA